MRRRARQFLTCMEQLPAEQVALLLAVGLVLGVFPIMGCPTFLCLAAGIALRLNLPALQLLNSLTSPLQLALLIPLARFGAWVRGGSLVTAGFTPERLGSAALDAATGWICICVPVGLLAYRVSLLAIRWRRGSCSNGLESLA